MSSKIDRAYFKLRAAQRQYQALERRTLEWLSTRLDASCYLSWSAGKDSMVMAHLCRRVNVTRPILCSDTGVPYRWSQGDKDKFTSWCEQHGWNVIYFNWDKWADRKAAAEVDEHEYRRRIHEGQFTALTEWANQHSLTRRVTGMRCAEGGDRKVFLATSRGETANSLHPLWNWSTEDVWTYTLRHDLPWLSIYDHLGPHARNGLIGKNGKQHGRLVYLKRHYPQAFQRACELFKARDYV